MRKESVIEESIQAVKEDVHLEGRESNLTAEKEVEGALGDAVKNAHRTGTDADIDMVTEKEITTDITSTGIRVRQHFK